VQKNDYYKTFVPIFSVAGIGMFVLSHPLLFQTGKEQLSRRFY